MSSLMAQFSVIAIAALAGAAMPANATELLTNGDFETGSFTGWTGNSEAGTDGHLYIQSNDGGTSPLSRFAYQLNATGGNWFAMTDQHGPGSYSLTQSFTVDGSSDIKVAFQFFANNVAGQASTTDPDRDFNATPNQNAEADILTGTADPFTTAAADIVQTLYGPGTDDPSGNPNPWKNYSFDLGVLAAGTYQIRFAETDTEDYLQMGVDNVSVDASPAVPATPAPEPASLALLAAGMAGLGFTRRRSNR